MKKLCILILALAVCLSTATLSHAKGGAFGLGVMGGEPSGLTAKLWTAGDQAIDFGASWSLGHEVIHLNADYLWHFRGLFGSNPRSGFALYAGLGGHVKLFDEIKIGARIPLGINYEFSGAPLEVFLETVPTVDLIPDTGFGGAGGLGIRYYF